MVNYALYVAVSPMNMYKLEGTTPIERYCSACSKRVYERSPVLQWLSTWRTASRL